MRDWYAKTFGAKPRETPNFAAADLPGVALNFTKSPDPVVGTQGRALDHIGFEVKNLEAFTKKLEGMGIKLERPYTKVPALNIAIAFIKDPWGTRTHSIGLGYAEPAPRDRLATNDQSA